MKIIHIRNFLTINLNENFQEYFVVQNQLLTIENEKKTKILKNEFSRWPTAAILDFSLTSTVQDLYLGQKSYLGHIHITTLINKNEGGPKCKRDLLANYWINMVEPRMTCVSTYFFK